MIEYDIYLKDCEYNAVRSKGSFCWQALLIGLIKIPFSTVIYPLYKGHKKIALIAFSLELFALILVLLLGGIFKAFGSLLILIAAFRIPIGYYAIQRKIANKYFGRFIGRYYGSSEEQAINEAIRKVNKSA